MSCNQIKSLSVLDYFNKEMKPKNLKLSKGAAVNYMVAINQLNKFKHALVRLCDLSEDLLLNFLSHLKETGTNSQRTLNNKRAAILMIWKHAAKRKLVKPPPAIDKFKEPRRKVRAWTPDEVARILEACRFAPKCHGWDGRHWRALVLVIYDTSHRVGALLLTPRSAISSEGKLHVQAEHSKHNADTIHQLHPETLKAISEMPYHTKLFPFPVSRREIWRQFREILLAAKLPTSRKDLFHKLRRTSFTLVYALLGHQAAREHAAHSSDVTESYLDKDLLKSIAKVPCPIDVLPRPQ